jgi:hypothetical protein
MSAVDALSMYFDMYNTPPECVSNPQLRGAFDLLGAVVPESCYVRAHVLHRAGKTVKQSKLECLVGKRYAIVTDSPSKRMATRGLQLFNLIMHLEDGPAVDW